VLPKSEDRIAYRTPYVRPAAVSPLNHEVVPVEAVLGPEAVAMRPVMREEGIVD
jgi:hypothetical protein